MSPRLLQRLILGLSIALCLGVVALLGLNQYRKSQDRQQDGRGSVASPSVFDQPLELKRFALTDQAGQPFTSEQLDGKVWIASFIFTRCPSVCPRVLAQTSALQAQLKLLPRWKDIALVSITVDPEFDTPPVLAQAAKTWNADADHWHFLTGEKAIVWPLIAGRDGFRQHVGKAEVDDPMPITHSSKYVLVDHLHRIRGFYDALDADSRKELLRDIERLLK